MIRPMVLADLPQVRLLARELGYEVSLEDVSERFNALQADSNYAFLVYVHDGEVVGWIQVSKEAANLLFAERIEIAALIVTQKCRSNGIGKKLVRKAEEWGIDQGYSLVRVRSNVTRSDAHRFYVREGYELKKTGHYFEKKIGGISPA